MGLIYLYLTDLLKHDSCYVTTWFKIQQFHVLYAVCIYVFCMYLRRNGDFCPIQHQMIGFYN